MGHLFWELGMTRGLSDERMYWIRSVYVGINERTDRHRVSVSVRARGKGPL